MDISKGFALRYKCNLELAIQGFTDILIKLHSKLQKAAENYPENLS